MYQPNKNMLNSTKKALSKTIAGLLVGTSLALAPLAVQAVNTNTLSFSNTTLGANNDGSNPSSGPVAFSGTGLNVGDVIVFDGIVIDNAPSTAGDWGAVDFNYGGTGGLTSATLGVMARDGTLVNAAYLCSFGRAQPVSTSATTRPPPPTTSAWSFPAPLPARRRT